MTFPAFFRRLAVCLMALAFSAAALATIEAALQMQTGNPSSATVDAANHTHYLIQRAQYALDYNDTTREANWVAWDLTAADSGGAARSDVFFQDTTLPAGFYQVRNTDYSGSGYDRGHMSPSADRTATRADNDATFYMSNMVPQSPDNNQGVWASFETYCRSLASAGNELLIISGPSIFGGSKISSGVAISGYTWKIAVVVPLGGGTALSRIDANTRVIAIKIPNIAGVRNNPWQQYITSAAQIETDTGLVFFTALTSSVAASLRTKLDGQSAAGTPAIVTQPAAQTAAVGGSATFSVTATGNAPLTYQWAKDEIDLAGATSATFTLATVAATHAGNYTVTITNSVGSVTSNAAALVITGLPPSITTQPAAITALAGNSALFSVGVSGSPTLVYQWRKGGTALPNGANVSGATTATLALSNIQSADAASYDVVVTNSSGNVTSAAAALTVTAAVPRITTQPAAQSTTTGGKASFTVAAAGTTPLTYQWRKAGANLANGANLSGTATATLTFTGVAAADAGSYDVVITNSVGSTTSTAAALTINTAAAGTIAYTGGTYTQNFDGLPSTGTFTLTGEGPIALDSAPISATNLAGWSFAKVSGSGSVALFNVGTGSANTGSAYSFGSAGATDRALGALLSGTTGSVWGVILTNNSGQTLSQFTLSYTGEQWRWGGSSTATVKDRVAFEYQLGGTSITAGTFTAASALDFSSPITSGTTGALDGNAAANRTTISATVSGLTWASGQTLVLRWRDIDVPGADDGLAIDDVSFTTPPVTASVVPAITSTTPAANTTGVASNAAITVTFNQAVTVANGWFTLSSAASGNLAATVTGGPTTYTLTPPVSFADNDTITVTLNAAQISDQATGTLRPAANTTFSFTTTAPVAPTITTPPAAQTVTAGANASFTVVASGAAPLSYQWRKGGVALTGNNSAATATLTLTAVTAASAGSYDCVVTNSLGSATSTAATLTVNSAPTTIAPAITTQPANLSVRVGSPATFTVVATGTPTPIYQWRKNGTAVVGATAATFTIASAQTSDAASYDVIVANSVGSISSALARLTVTTADSAPVITSQPHDVTALRGQSATFTVVASGVPAPTYQWFYRRGIAFNAEAIIAGANAATLTLPNVQSIDAGVYTVVVTNSAGFVRSMTVALRVTPRSFAGDYFGAIGGLGSFALHVRDDNTGVFLGFLTGSKTPCLARDLAIDENGRFTFTAESALNFDGTIGIDGALIGTLSGTATATLTATRSAAGATNALAGVYQASVAGSSTTAFAIVSPAGQAFVLTQTAARADAGTGLIDSSGRIAITTAASQSIAGTLAADSSLSLTVSAALGQPFTLTGASDVVVAAQRFVNVSTRAISDTGAGATIAGLVISGQDSKPILLRAIGPGLAAFGVSGVLAKPLLQLYSGSTLVASNAGWSTNSNLDEVASAAGRVGAFPLAAASADSATFVTLAPGPYTAVITGADGGTGVVLVEAYDVSTPAAGQKVINISTRSQVGSGDNVCIAGFVVTGSVPKRVLIRGVGPTLAQFGLTGVLAKPQLTLYRGSTALAQNAGWAASADAAQITITATRVGAFPFTSNDEAALLLSLEPGSYTAVLSGVNNTTGVGLVEVYEVP